MAKEDDNDVVRLAPQDDPAAAAAPEVAIHLSSPSSASSMLSSSSCLSPSAPSLTVLAPLPWLLRIPYFATSLQQPWLPSSPSAPLHLSLECTRSSSPHAYLRCLQLLRSLRPCSPHMFASIPDVLELLPVADHLLFDECWHACMSFLAASPWSYEEEDNIRTTISNLAFKASADVLERLDTSNDIAALESMLDSMLSSSSSESYVISLCEKHLESSPTPIKAIFQHVLWKLHTKYANKVIPLPPNFRRSYPVSDRSIFLPYEWYVTTKLLLRFTDAHDLIVELINLEDVMWLLSKPRNRDREKDMSEHIVKDILYKALTKAVFLTNSQRAILVKRLRWPYDASIDLLRQSLAETLPLANQHRMDMVQRDVNSSVWFDHVLHRVGQLDEQSIKGFMSKRG